MNTSKSTESINRLSCNGKSKITKKQIKKLTKSLKLLFKNQIGIH